MPLTAYPGGVSSYGFPLIGSGPYMGVGNVFFVCSLNGNDANGRGTDPSRPFKTINFAISKCFAPSGSKAGGDFIFVLPGHVEQLSVAGSAASPGPIGSISVNVAGVSVIGLGNNAQRPLVQWTAVGGQLLINQPNVRFENIVFDMATQINAVTAAVRIVSTGIQFNNCLCISSTTANAALIAFQLAAGWGDFSMLGTQGISNSGLSAAGATSFIAAVAGDRLQLRWCNIQGDYSNSLIDGAAIIVTNILMEFGEYGNNNAARLIIKANNASTGFIREIHTFVNGGAVAGVVSCTGLCWSQCFGKGSPSGVQSAIAVPGVNTY